MTVCSGSSTPTDQRDLFEERGAWCGEEDRHQDIDDAHPGTLPDNDIVDQIAQAKLSNVEALCAQIVERSLGDLAVPGLVTLWNRFKGFGITEPLLEQQLALKTLSEIGSAAAKDALRQILSVPDLPDSQLPFALQAARTVALRIPQVQILPWLEHDMPLVRALAFSLIQPSNPPLDTLEIGFSDPDPSVRRAALVSAGNLGHGRAKPGLLAEFRKNPTSQTIQALGAIADEDVIVEIGRYALENSTHQTQIADELEALENEKASAIAQRIRKQIKQR